MWFHAWFGDKPLSGKRVLVTATKNMAKDLSGRITELGGEAVDFSLVRTTPIVNFLVKSAVDDIESYTWAVFTSKNGVDIFFNYIKETHMDIRRLVNIKFAVIGDGTAKALESHGIFSDFVPTSYSSADLAKSLIPTLKKQDKLILLRAEEASRELTDALDTAEIAYTDVSLYKTSYDMRKAEELNRVLPLVDYITFCSSSAVKAFDAMVEDKDSLKARVVCIGPVTEKTAKKLGYEIYKTASVYNTSGVVACID